MTTRLVSFLGLGKDTAAPHYTPVVYSWDGRCASETPLVENALIELFEPDHVIVLGTAAVRQRWLDTGLLAEHLGRKIESGATPAEGSASFLEVPDGKSTEELRAIFEKVLRVLGVGSAVEGAWPRADRILLDITHGFRIQPILATSALAFAMSEWEREGVELPEVQVLYGAFEAGEGDEPRPIWDLTEIVTVSRWNAALDALLRYGRADALEALAQSTSKAAKDAARQHGVAGRELGRPDWLRRVGERARRFADDLALGRVRDLFTKSAPGLQKQLEHEHSEAWVREMPVLRGALDALRKAVAPLCSPNVLGREGVHAMTALAAQYERTQRFAELAGTLRENLVTVLALLEGHAPAADPGPGFSGEERAQRERELGDLSKRGAEGHAGLHDVRGNVARLAVDVMQTRNDIEHMGLRQHPVGSVQLRNQLSRQRARLAELVAMLSPAEGA